MPNTNYTIRPARPSDLETLPAIAQSAGDMFRDSPYPFLADDTMPTVQINSPNEFVWVVADANDHPVGFALVQIHDMFISIKELDVYQHHARQGLGGRLLLELAEWARQQGYSALVLTTFADVPWNGPYYARLGFRTLDVTICSSALQALWQNETPKGVSKEQRICMQLDL